MVECLQNGQLGQPAPDLDKKIHLWHKMDEQQPYIESGETRFSLYQEVE